MQSSLVAYNNNNNNNFNDMNNMECVLKEDVKENCHRTLSEIGASPALCTFYADALQCEYDMTHTIYRLQSELRQEVNKCDPLPAETLLIQLQGMMKYFHSWKTKINDLGKKGNTVPPLQVNFTRFADSHVFTAPCSLETNEVNLKEGDEVFITDDSQPNWLKVRNSKGEEGYVPAISCILPTPDNSALTAVERLQILLVTSWTECIRKLRSYLISTLANSSQHIMSLWQEHQQERSRDEMSTRVGTRIKRLVDCVFHKQGKSGLDLTRLQKYLRHLEAELLLMRASNGMSMMKVTVANMDKVVLCYKSFYEQWRSIRLSLKDASRPIRIVEHWEELRRASQCKNFKYYEVKMTLEDLETLEEITYVNPNTGEVYTSSVRMQRESAKAEELTSVSQEERKRFIIRAVTDPRTNKEIAFKDAVEEGIISHRLGLYVNPDTGEGIPIPEAMKTGHIAVVYTSVRKSPPKADVMALITIRRRMDRRYTITGAIDATTAERVDLIEARRRGLIDEVDGLYNNGLTLKTMPLEEAVLDGWVLAEFDDSEPVYECETYAVISVVDQVLKRSVTFVQAVRRGLIDRDTGNYVNNANGRKTYVADAMRLGFLKARRLPNADGLDIFAGDNMVVDEERPATPSGGGGRFFGNGSIEVNVGPFEPHYQ